MAKKTAAQVSEKWARNLKGATEEIRRGIDAVEVSPPAMAAEKAEKLRTKWLEAFETMIDRMRSVSLEDWKKYTKAGVGKIAIGVDAKGKDRMISILFSQF